MKIPMLHQNDISIPTTLSLTSFSPGVYQSYTDSELTKIKPDYKYWFVLKYVPLTVI